MLALKMLIYAIVNSAFSGFAWESASVTTSCLFPFFLHIWKIIYIFALL